MRKSPPARRVRNSCLQALETARAYSSDLSLRDILVFLYVAENEGINLRELAYASGSTHSTASRTARSLAAPGTRDALLPSLGLLEVRLSSTDMRGRTLHLSERGRVLRDALDKAILTAVPIVSTGLAHGTTRGAYGLVNIPCE